MRIIDITQELFSCVVYPGDPAPVFERVKRIPEDMCNLTNISLCVHNGTHADAPRHFIGDGKAIDEVELSAFYGDCTVAELSGELTAADVAPYLGAERLLLKGTLTITPEAAKAIANSGVRLIGVESQSVGTEDAPAPVPLILLGAGVIALEGLVLSEVEPGEYTLCAFPLKLSGSDGSPVRAVLICK
ncbi:MAG: cyclase family protein [Oscillospiraceae bacterium]|jgi:arylformamidase|nr:cyclase family protein [Oscillospiraceae bacterium]